VRGGGKNPSIAICSLVDRLCADDPRLEGVLEGGAGDEEPEVVAVELLQGRVELRVAVLEVLRLVRWQSLASDGMPVWGNPPPS